MKIRRLGIDATVDMEFFARAPAVLAFLTGARRRVGLHRFTTEGPYRGDLLTHRVAAQPLPAHGRRLLPAGRGAAARPATRCRCPRSRCPRIDFSPPALEPTAKEVQTVRRAISEASRKPGAPLPTALAGDQYRGRARRAAGPAEPQCRRSAAAAALADRTVHRAGPADACRTTRR